MGKGRLPVVDGGRLVEIVAKTDVLSALIDTFDIEGVGVRVEVRSLVLAPHGPERYAAFVRVATIDVTTLRGRLRTAGFELADLSDFFD